MLHTPDFAAADHAVVVTLRAGVVHTEVVANEHVAEKQQQALIGQTLLRIIRDVDFRTASIVASELEGATPTAGRRNILEWVDAETNAAFAMIAEQRRRELAAYAYAEDLEPSVTRA